MKIISKFISLSFLFISFQGFGQNGATLDMTFNSGDSIPYGTGIGPGGTEVVHDFKLQADGKMILVGAFNQYNNQPVSKIIRIMGNGDLDTSFHASISATGEYVKAVYIQSDGKILIGGNFTEISGTPVNRLVRLNTDGSIDPTFNVGNGITGSNAVTTVEDIQMDANGKILVGGRFSMYNGNFFKGLVRLNNDGSIDNTFIIGSGFSENLNVPGVYAIEFQNDGKLLIGGRFHGFNGQPRNHFVRLNTDGSLDSTLVIGTGFGTNSAIYSINHLPNGKLILAGSFSSYNGIAAGRIVRLNADGSFDYSFNTNTAGTLSLAGANSEIHKTVILDNGRIIAAGAFTTYNSTFSPALISLTENGYTDSVSAFAAQSIIYNVIVLANDRILIAGSFSKGIAKFLPDRSIDYSFLPGGAFNNGINTIVVQPDHKILVNGNFTSYFGSQDKNFCRLNEDGSMDPSFHPGFLNYPGVKEMIVLSDGKILMTGSYTSLDTLTRYATRLNPDGSIDPTFLSPTNTSVSGNCMLLLPSGKILVGGTNFIYRLNADGTLDNTFVPPGISGPINALGLLPNGKILVGGDFDAYTPAPFFVPLGSTLIQLDSTGAWDSTFQVTINGANPLINDILVQDDQKITIAGSFFSVNGTTRYNLSRLNEDGSIDLPFTAYTNGTITKIEESADGRIIVAGGFTQMNGVSRPYLGRINPNGSLDLSFNLTLNIGVTTIAQDVDDRIVVGGSFTEINNQQRNRIARINQGCPYLFGSDTITEIDHYTWPANGNTYTMSGQYQDTISSISGCDSIVRLNLTLTELQVNYFVSPSQVDSCNGSVNITATAGIPNFTFELDNGTSTTTSQYALFDSLCPGIHSVLVTDGNGDTLNMTFIIPTDSTNILIDPFDDDVIVDTSVVLFENCDIDFNSIDTIYLDSYSILGGDTTLINWAVVDANGITIVPTILVLSIGNNYFQLQLYCPNKSIDKFFVFTIGLVYNGTGISTLDVPEGSVDIFTIYPNPTNEQVRINFSGSDAELKVYDLQGKIVLKDRIQNQGIISLQNFERGVYLFDFKNSHGHCVQRVVKQ